jgi:hypothetical protein
MLGSVVCPSAFGANAYLEIDGILNVNGGSLDKATMTVARGAKVVEVWTSDLRHITMKLALDSTYTLSFARPGYLTKALFFDTRMTNEAREQGPYSFRFDVTLVASTNSDGEGYVGPVGYIRFNPEKGDFSYDVDYRRTHTAKGELLATPEPLAVAPGVSVSDKRDRRERRWSPPFVDPTKDMLRMAAAVQKGDHANASMRTTMAGGAVAVVGSPSAAEQEGVRVERSTIVEQEREITIVRVRSAQGQLTEYRRIKHANGMLLHYKNSSNCTYQEYMNAVGE